MQDEIARLMLDYAEDGHALYQFSAEEAAEVDKAEAAVARGDFAADGELQALWAKHSLCSHALHDLPFGS